MAENLAKQLEQGGARLQYPEKIDRGRQFLDQTVQPSQRLCGIGGLCDCIHQIGQDRLKGFLRSSRAERSDLAAAPAPDRVHKGRSFDNIFRCEQAGQLLFVRRQTRAVLGLDQIVIDLANRFHMRPQQIEQGLPVIESVQPGHPVERRRLVGQAVRLLVIDHLQPVLDRPVQGIGLTKRLRLLAIDPARPGQRN